MIRSSIEQTASQRKLALTRMRRAGVVFTTACLASVVACSSNAPPGADDGSLGASHGALTGTVSFDSSCTSAPSPQTTPPTVPGNVVKHLQISEAYARIAANSPAFRECIQNVMTRPTTLGVPGRGTWVSGPYYACNGDPGPATLGTVMSHVLATTGTRISCDYAASGTGLGGEAFVGDITSGHENISFGSELGDLNAAENCPYNPDGAPCVGDAVHDASAQTIAHEVMHTQGYSHVSDYVSNLDNVNVGNTVGTHVLTLGDFCGITPTSSIHPTYGSGIPYEVGQCVQTVLDWSEASGHLHDDCGARYAGLTLVDSVTSGTPASASTHCVSDPYVGDAYPSHAGEAPIPPHAPVSCTVTPSCLTTQPAAVHCADDNANLEHLERRPSGGTGAWQRVSGFTAGFDYRVCAESLYGRACSLATVAAPSFCGPSKTRFRPIPWWDWVPFTGLVADGSPLSKVLGGALIAVPVPVDQRANYPELGALGVGVYDPQIGQFSALGASTGALPPLSGAAFTMALGNDGQAHLLGIGGDDAQGNPDANFYDGALSLGTANQGTSTSWTQAPSFDARTHASAATDASGQNVFVFGGRSTKGTFGDLWAYAVGKGAWSLVSAQAAAPRVDAAMTFDGSSLVVFGGRDASGKALNDLLVIDAATGKTQSIATTLVPRANAAIVVRQGQAFIYGGQTDSGASELLDVVSLAEGKTLSSSKVGVAASSGSALGLDADGVLTLIPGAVPGAQGKAGAFVGFAGQPLTFVAN